LDDATIASFQSELARMGYRFQFVTRAGYHAVCASMFDLAAGYAAEGMSAYVKLLRHELSQFEAVFVA
jgi:isocitrate lyase